MTPSPNKRNHKIEWTPKQRGILVVAIIFSLGIYIYSLFLTKRFSCEGPLSMQGADNSLPIFLSGIFLVLINILIYQLLTPSHRKIAFWGPIGVILLFSLGFYLNNRTLDFINFWAFERIYPLSSSLEIKREKSQTDFFFLGHKALINLNYSSSNGTVNDIYTLDSNDAISPIKTEQKELLGESYYFSPTRRYLAINESGKNNTRYLQYDDPKTADCRELPPPNYGEIKIYNLLDSSLITVTSKNSYRRIGGLFITPDERYLFFRVSGLKEYIVAKMDMETLNINYITDKRAQFKQVPYYMADNIGTGSSLWPGITESYIKTKSQDMWGSSKVTVKDNKDGYSSNRYCSLQPLVKSQPPQNNKIMVGESLDYEAERPLKVFFDSASISPDGCVYSFYITPENNMLFAFKPGLDQSTGGVYYYQSKNAKISKISDALPAGELINLIWLNGIGR